MADRNQGRVVAGPLSAFLTEQEIVELPLSGERIAKAYKANNPFFNLPFGVNPEEEFTKFFEGNCLPDSRHTIYVTWVEDNAYQSARYEVSVGGAGSTTCKLDNLARHNVARSVVATFGSSLAAERFYLPSFEGRGANKDRRFEARFRRNDFGELVELTVFEERRVKTKLGRDLQELTGGPRVPGWDGKNVLRYNFVLGVGYLF